MLVLNRLHEGKLGRQSALSLGNPRAKRMSATRVLGNGFPHREHSQQTSGGAANLGAPAALHVSSARILGGKFPAVDLADDSLRQ